jgi:type I restriction enzyme R subunit
MNEDETRAELIDPKLKESGWGVIEGSKINRNFPITLGRIQTGNIRASPIRADYILSYKGRKLAVIEAKSDKKEVGEGVAQAKEYALKLYLETTFATNSQRLMNYGIKHSTLKTIGKKNLMQFQGVESTNLDFIKKLQQIML